MKMNRILVVAMAGLGVAGWSMSASADAAAGKATFEAVCAECHEAGDFEGEDAKALADSLTKIPDGNECWHRMGDLGWMDKKGRIWFCGRKSHRVVTSRETLYTIPCEAIFNTHPLVLRSALVGIGAPSRQLPVICIELKKTNGRAQRKAVRAELLELAARNDMTQQIRHILFHDSFPVDIRHNAKIFRERLAVWAARRVKPTAFRGRRRPEAG